MSNTHPATTTVLVDTDALIDLDAWEELVREKRWLHFYLRIAEAPQRNSQLLDALELAQADGCRIAYSSRWPELTSYLVKPWLEANGYPGGFINWRRAAWASAAELGALHAAAAARRGAVLMIHNDEAVAAEMRQRFGIAALTPVQLPATTDGLRRVFSLAREVPKFELPKRQAKKQPKKQETAA
jgi:hypothetical protein